MNSKLIFIFALFVILPTAVLGLLAVRSIKDRERLLLENLKSSAQTSLSEISRSALSMINDDLGRVRLAMTDCLVRGWDIQNANAAVEGLKSAIPGLMDVYVFMNPWGFLYPPEYESKKTHLPEQAMENREQLISELRKAIADDEEIKNIALVINGGRYVFAPLQRRKSLYVGCRFDPSLLRKLVEDQAKLYKGGMYRVVIRYEPIERHEEIIVDNPFRKQGIRSRSYNAVSRHGRILAERELPAPLDGIKIAAIANLPEDEMLSESSRAGLFIWAIALLTLGILTGAALVLIQMYKKAERAEERSSFIAGISHDLRTPLASVRMLSESLYLGRIPDPEKQKQFLSRIVSETKRLEDLVNRVMFFVRYSEGERHFYGGAVSINISEVISRTVESIENRYCADSSGTKPLIKVEIKNDLPPVKGDRAAIEQVFMNLVDNAVKYSQSFKNCNRSEGSGGDKDVKIEACPVVMKLLGRRRLFVRIKVKDSGIGMDRAELRKIFRPYYRGESAKSVNLSGIGLGLSISKRIVRNHGGWIEVQSKKGEGSEFSVFFPADEGNRV